MKGLQLNTENDDTDCAVQAEQARKKIRLTYDSIENFSFSDIFAPFNYFQYFLVEFSDCLISCKISAMLSLLDTRLSTLAGAFDLVATYVSAYLSDDDQWTNILAIFNDDATNCEGEGKRYGKLFAQALDFGAPNNVFYNDVFWAAKFVN